MSLSVNIRGSSVVRVGVLGCGNVGAALVQLLEEQVEVIAARTGLTLEVARVAVRDLAKRRAVELDDQVVTDDASAVVAEPDIDVVVELIGGIEPAKSLILQALRQGKPVITANKELLADAGAELFEAAEKAGVDLLFEAAVGGGIPLIRPLRESLAGERINRIMGIVNGTTNYILTRMTEAGDPYQQALAEAQSLGYAERDPTADVEGHDAGAKAAILASIAFGVKVVASDVYREGISGVSTDDIAFARRLGYVIKLLAIAERHLPTGEVGVRAHPVMIPLEHPLAAVRESFNAVFIEGAAVGELMLYGRGAGGRPTASAVLGDLIDAAANLRRGTSAPVGGLVPARLRPIEALRSQYYLSLDVADRPGALHAVAGVFGLHGVSIWKMEQEGMGAEARLVFITHTVTERSMQATLADLQELDAVDHINSLLRVIGPE